MTTQLSPAALRFLAWIRDNEHHAFNWIEDDDGCFHTLELSGYAVGTKTPRSVVMEAGDFFEPDPNYDNTKKMYRPNAAGMKALEGARA